MPLKALLITAAVTIAGGVAGQALGGFATGGAASAWTGRNGLDAPAGFDPAYAYSGAPLDPAPSEARSDGPSDYSCRGCGPGIAERRMYDGYPPVDRHFVDTGPVEPPAYSNLDSADQ